MPAKLIIKNEVRIHFFVPYTPRFYLPTQKSAIPNSPDSLHATSITKSSCIHSIYRKNTYLCIVSVFSLRLLPEQPTQT